MDKKSYLAAGVGKVRSGVSSGAADSAHSTADESKGIVEVPEDIEFGPSKHLVQNSASVHATAGESEEITGSLG